MNHVQQINKLGWDFGSWTSEYLRECGPADFKSTHHLQQKFSCALWEEKIKCRKHFVGSIADKCHLGKNGELGKRVQIEIFSFLKTYFTLISQSNMKKQ